MATYTGNAKNNTFTGTQASDTFFGKGGDDTLNGKGGVDTAIFRGSFEQYQIKHAADQAHLKVGVTGPDGNDHLTNIELLKFDNGTYDVTNHHFTPNPPPPPPEVKKIALTFDDGPDPTWTPQVLKVLQDHGVKATFFELGENIEANPDLAKAVVAGGNLLENHTFDHPHLPNLTAAQITTEIQRTSDDIFKFTGTTPEYVRPPYGEVNQKVENSIESMHLKTALWTVDTNDWQVDDGVKITEQQIVNTVLNNATDNGIVLMHDAGGDRHLTVAALDNIIDGLHAQGYELVTLDQIPTLPHWDLFA